MTNWHPDIASMPGPRYLAIATAIRRDIQQGKLHPGDRLPPHRDLAWSLGVTTGTVTRAYREAERLGLVSGEVGRGTYVRGGPGAGALLSSMAVSERTRDAPADGQVDLSRNEPPPCPLAAQALQRTLADIARDAPLGEFLTYQPTGGMRRHREAGARWLGGLGVPVPAEEILMTAGGQHALTVALMAVCRAGNLVLTEELTYPGLRGLAALLGIRLQGLAMDEHGIRPDAFEAACRSGGARLLYLMPSLQNPTASTMPAARRAEIVAIAATHGVLLIEDDVYGVLMGDSVAPIAALAPAGTFYLTGLKVLGPGLRVGILRVPPAHMAAAQAALRATMWMAPPLTG